MNANRLPTNHCPLYPHWLYAVMCGCVGLVLGILLAHGIWLHYTNDYMCLGQAPVITDDEMAEILYQLEGSEAAKEVK